MDISSLTYQARMDYARQALYHPAKILGTTVDKLMEMPTEELIVVASDLEYVRQHYELASIWVFASIMLRDDYTALDINRIAYLNNKANMAGYYPKQYFSTRVGTLLRALEWGSVDKTLYATLSHYNTIDSFFNTKYIEKRETFLGIGLTPKKIMHSAMFLRWVPGYLKKILTKLYELITTMKIGDEIREFSMIKNFVDKYFPKIQDVLEEQREKDLQKEDVSDG